MSVLFFNILLLASAFAWLRIAGRVLAQRPILPRSECERGRLDLVVPVMALILWIAIPKIIQAVLQAVLVGSNEAEPSLVDETGIERVKVACFATALFISVMPLLLLITPSSSLNPSQSSFAPFGITLTDWRSQVVDGASGFIACLLPVCATLWATDSLRSKEALHPFLKLLSESPETSTVLWISVSAVLLAPLAEELLFRVVLQGWLEQHLSRPAAIGLVAVAFSAFHPFPDGLPLFPLALVLGYVYSQRHSYLAVVTLHALFNGLNLLIAI